MKKYKNEILSVSSEDESMSYQSTEATASENDEEQNEIGIVAHTSSSMEPSVKPKPFHTTFRFFLDEYAYGETRGAKRKWNVLRY